MTTTTWSTGSAGRRRRVTAALAAWGCFLSTDTAIADVLSGPFNTASGTYATVAGGYVNTAIGDASVITGGNKNTVSGGHAIIGGGWYNTASGEASVIGGGWHNTATDMRSTIGGGGGNKAFGGCSTVAGGRHNYATGYASTVAGGGADDETKTNGHMASGNFSAVLGGHDNTASGDYSLAMGHKARVDDAHAGVIALSADLASTCESMGESTLNLCVDNGLYLNSQLLDVAALVARVEQQDQEIADLKAAVAALQNAKDTPVKFVPDKDTFTTAPAELTTRAATGSCGWWSCS